MFNFSMTLQGFDAIPFFFDLIDNISVIIEEEVEKRCEYDIISGSCVGVAVDSGVNVDGNHGIVNDPAKCLMKYKANMKTFTRMNYIKESIVLRTKNFTKF